ncbi:50S ribosomal protein L6 [Endogone sp. FLAS-F59071]|nr:50S ribosomal protein L6 [Endogone sp. FLAS-F59071]|eukprot:RUS16822.1 50S ribosomal protein L6 [Endogone sp. FLAS-F59071]
MASLPSRMFTQLARHACRTFSTTALNCSHIGRQVIIYPSEVQITHDPTPIRKPRIPSELNNTLLTIKGPLGMETLPIKPFILLNIENDEQTGSNKLQIAVTDATVKEQCAMWGTTRALIQNYVTGVSEGFRVPLRISGVGYRAAIENGKLALKLGYSHPIELDIPPGITVTIPIPTKIMLQGTDLQKVKEFAAQIRKWREPEPYNQKGVFIGDETIKKKDGKKK